MWVLAGAVRLNSLTYNSLTLDIFSGNGWHSTGIDNYHNSICQSTAIENIINDDRE